MNEFQKDFADAIYDVMEKWYWDGEKGYSTTDGGERVLKMPEMQSIRRFIKVDADIHAAVAGLTSEHWLRNVVDLPVSVVEWALS